MIMARPGADITTNDHIIIKHEGLTVSAPLDPGEEVRRECARLILEGVREQAIEVLRMPKVEAQTDSDRR